MRQRQPSTTSFLHPTPASRSHSPCSRLTRTGQGQRRSALAIYICAAVAHNSASAKPSDEQGVSRKRTGAPAGTLCFPSASSRAHAKCCFSFAQSHDSAAWHSTSAACAALSSSGQSASSSATASPSCTALATHTRVTPGFSAHRAANLCVRLGVVHLSPPGLPAGWVAAHQQGR